MGEKEKNGTKMGKIGTIMGEKVGKGGKKGTKMGEKSKNGTKMGKIGTLTGEKIGQKCGNAPSPPI